MKNKIALFFLVVSLSTMIDPILAGNNIPSSNKNKSSGIGLNKIPLAKTTETENGLKKKESYIPAVIVFGSLLIKIISYISSDIRKGDMYW